MIKYARLLFFTSIIVSVYLDASTKDPVPWVRVKRNKDKDKKKGSWESYSAKSKDHTLACTVCFYQKTNQYKGRIKHPDGVQHLKKVDAIAQFEVLAALYDPKKTYEESSDEISDIE